MSSSGYLPRIIDSELDSWLAGLPAVALEGAKWVGKTSTAERRAATVRRLDSPAEQSLARADPAVVLRGAGPVLLDEWQRVPQVWDAVRRAVDDGAPPGRFLLTGSAAPLELPSHSGAGRIVSMRMRPMSLAERGLVVPTVSIAQLLQGGRPPLSGESSIELPDYCEQIVASGFPAIRGLASGLREVQLDGYITRIVERDFDDVGHRIRSPQTLRRWMTAYAAATATCASYETIRAAATGSEGITPARTTTQPYRDVLERLFLIDAIPGWLPTRNRTARASAAVKHHLADPALAARLMGVGVDALLDGADRPSPSLRDGPLLGALFESLVAQSVQTYAAACRCRVGHMRGRSGSYEIDLIVERPDGGVIAIEVKLGGAIDDHDVRHLHWLTRQIGDDLLDALVITTGRDAYRRPDGIGVVPAVLLGP